MGLTAVSFPPLLSFYTPKDKPQTNENLPRVMGEKVLFKNLGSKYLI